ncbi:MAG: dockerin type I repeat-containing protein [Clostridia bacterium]|nr:dockerin type I repeat-containing protein [Clostridia bacterium]
MTGNAAEYQNFVANADVITVDIGANNFGVYASNRIFNNMFDADFTRFDEGTQRDIAKVKGEIDSLLGTYVSDALTPELAGMMEHIVDTMTYALVGFCVNFDASMERIYALNPDATVVVVNIQNLMHDLYATLPGLDQPFAFGEFYGAIVNMANAYIATGSPYSDRYFCAYIGADGQAETFLKDIQDYTGNPADLRTAVTDCFDVYDNSMYVKTRVLQGLLREYKNLVSVNSPYTKDEILDGSDTGLEKFSTAVYENEITIAGVMTVQEFLAYGANGNLSGDLLSAYNLYNTALLTVYDTAATFMQLGANSTVMDLAAAAANFATQGEVVLETMFDMLVASMSNPGLEIETTPEFQALANDPTAMAIITLGVRSDLGNSFFSHPNENGHVEIKNAILAAIDDEIKGDELVMNEIVDALQFVHKYIVENYNEIYYNAWKLAKANGFVDMANGYIDQVAAAINSIDYSALADKTHLIPTLDALKAEVLGDVVALRTLINNQNHPTAGEITALMNELNNDLIALQNVAAQAGIDAVAQLITLHAQILKQYDIAYNQACAYICEQLGQAYDVIVAEITRIAAEQNAAAAEKIAQYLGQNPADLIDTILKYGADAQAFINYWSYYAEMLLGPAWNEYGEDITAFVQENIAKLLSSLKAEAGNLSAEAANALLSYIDDLKITENVYAIASQLQNGGMQIGWNTLTELEAIVNGLNDQLIVNAAAAIQALEALAASQDAAAAKAIIDAAIAEIRTTEAERMAAIDAIYANILSAKAALTTAADAINDLQSAAQVLGSLIENPAAFNFDSAVEAITTLLNELDAAVATVKAATAQIVTLTNDVSVTAQSICREAAASKTQIMDALYTAETVLQTSGVATETLMRNAYAAAEAYVVGTLNKVNADMVSLLTLCNTELQNAVNNVVTAVNTCLYNATHGEYEIDRFSKYVALGGNAAYADELAALLGLSDRYVKMALTDNYLAEVAGADLVTVKLDNGEFLTFAYNQVMGMAAELINGNASLVNLMKNPYYGATVKEYLTAYVNLDAKAEELNWSAYLDARAQGVLRETLANVKTLMLQDGVPEVYAFDIGAILTEMLNEGSDEDFIVVNLVLEIPVADLAVAAIENVLYAYVRFANEFSSVLNTIHAVSPEAEVVVTGIQNPVTGMSLNIAGTEVNVSAYAEYVDYIVDVLNLHLYAYALATDNTTYVESNTATDIRNALNVTYKGLMGDVNNDGAVTLVDAILVLDYSNGMIGAEGLTLGMADVDGDGEVKLVDAILILDFSNGVLEYFPAELQ